mmetsp:Transcript_37928/g.62945  ORF Transcript_37928/g.62945 Transcript_37928/m.62945 type:complete len:686 (-) Transcript_37928:552-2609(-)
MRRTDLETLVSRLKQAYGAYFQSFRYSKDESKIDLAVSQNDCPIRLSLIIPDDYPSEPLILINESDTNEAEARFENVRRGLAEENPCVESTIERILHEFAGKSMSQVKRRKTNEVINLDSSDESTEEEETSKPSSSKMSISFKAESPVDDDDDDDDAHIMSDTDVPLSHQAAGFDFGSADETGSSALLAAHVREACELLPEHYITCLEALRVVRFHLLTSVFEEHVATALGVNRDLPIQVNLTFCPEYLDAKKISDVSIFQKGEGGHQTSTFGLQFQLTEILKKFLREHWPKTHATSSSRRHAISSTVHDNALATLLEMGFDTIQARVALRSTNNNLDAAVHILSEHKTDHDCFLPERHNNLLQRLIVYMQGRLANCASFCIICDERLESSGLKPVVCGAEPCIWRYEELGLGANPMAEIAAWPQTVDLLISMIVAADTGQRRALTVDPFPREFLGTSGEKNFTDLRAMLELFPSVEEMSKVADLKEHLDKRDPAKKRLYKLLRWLLATNRCHLVKVEESKLFQAMGTPHQYILYSSPPERESKFRQLKKQYGTFLAFHGSPLENWHCILRRGLKNASGTPLQQHGAAYGSGIYLSPQSSVSQQYMRAGTSWAKSKFGGGSMSCLAVCEVIQHPDLKGQPNPHYVIKQEDYVLTRLFCIYTQGNPPNVDLSKTQKEMRTFFDSLT